MSEVLGMIAQLERWPELYALGTERLAQLVDATRLSALQKAQALAILAASDYLFEQCVRHPQWLFELLDTSLSEQLPTLLNAPLWQQQLLELDEVAVKCALRERRQQVFTRIAWLELSGQISVEQSIQWLSQFADCAIQTAIKWLVHNLQPVYGIASDAQNNPQNMTVLAMGKLGGGELNFSSDIDLIFSYPHQGHTQGGRRQLANQQYFIRLGQQLIQLLGQTTADGFVFRVDMRLRPFGDSGPLAVSHTALEDYYQNHGRDWERYAMVKVRCINDEDADIQLQTMLRPFVYRRYIDFGVVDSLRRMKSMILAEVRRRKLSGHIKLGRGGIREIEFIVQAQQLIWGGRFVSLQQRSLLVALKQLTLENILTPLQHRCLADSYLFLRRVENYLQEFHDQQTQSLPQDPLAQCRLAWVMGYTSWAEAEQQIHAVLQQVSRCFDDLFGHPLPEQHPLDSQFEALWQVDDDDNHADLDVSAEFIGLVREFRHQVQRRVFGEKGQQTLDQLMPRLLPMILAYPAAEQLASRLFKLLSQILSRSAYLQLLLENPGALKQLLKLCDASKLVAEQLSLYPMLLDELLDPQILYQVYPDETYAQQLSQFMLRIAPDDLEQQIDALRQFKQIQILRIAAADSAGALPVMKVSDRLTELAQALCVQVVELAWQQMIDRYGYPDGIDATNLQRGFAIIGYGKLGGIELGYGSDLDLVFIHNCDSYASTSGPKVIDSKQFYLRLAQRIMHLFQTRSRAGILYEVDMRLRPSGNAGLLVSSWSAYRDYQRQQAWTWEHQALVRSRIIEGDGALESIFDSLRHELLSRPRDINELNENILSMREKMRQHLDRSDQQQVDLKQTVGGMVDIEFIAQQLVLAHSHQYPQLTRWPDNVRIFEQAQTCGLLTDTQAKQLTETYLALRNESHRQALQAHREMFAREKLAPELVAGMASIVQIWAQIFECSV
ncbi:bifunctional [glutamate--ammonia ligase]-adenylyl-L-tyrosine phosphorylase/[glutamate--ammonia-ligase] adenylyltransferase [Celerinatantimonas yamalensis]|uniref:Bifunctional glutamine synthetase adenylyltransferase/adenylyl-removing enzyme n=1 Tax=Celerinatantimonas yamalensis TaxID=559956 RepID=A0ABW9GA16_9GAMM